MPKSSGKWRASAAKEKQKLDIAEDGWLLAGRETPVTGRTRSQHQAKATPESAIVVMPVSRAAAARAPPEQEDDISALSTVTRGAASSSTNTTSSRSFGPNHLRKPPASRVILDVLPLKTMLETHLAPCPHCRARLVVSFPTKGIASGCQLKCLYFGKEEHQCKFVATAAAEVTDFVARRTASVNIGRNTDYAANILYVLGFIASGDGGTEAARILGLLGLPNSTTMQSRSFGNIEDAIGPTIVRLGDRIIHENLCDEVKLVYGDAKNDDGDSLFELWMSDSDKLTKDEWPRIKAGTDMGWNQKGSGRKYNSQSGHCFFCGSHKRQVIAKATCSKACATCKSWYTTHTVDEKVPPHDWCTITYHGTSQSMEPNAVLELYETLYNKRVIVSVIICDDDSSIKAKLKWSNADYKTNNNTNSTPKIINSNGKLVARPDHGALKPWMPEPSYVADPNHRRKTLSGMLYKLRDKPKTTPEEQHKKYKKKWLKQQQESYDKAVEKAKKDNTAMPPPLDPKREPPKKKYIWNLTMTSMDCTRLSKNFAFMARSLHRQTSNEAIVNCGKCVVEHHFDNHENCGDWCRRKSQTTEDERKKHFFRCKTKDKLLYAELCRIVKRFVTLEALLEVAHDMDTLVNESLNNTITWLAPKNKVYCGTISLAIRIAIAIGITSLGTLLFYTELFRVLGIQTTADVIHWLEVKDGSRSRRLTKTKTKEFKKRRLKYKYEKLKDATKQAQQERDKRDGTYQPGIGLTGGYDERDEGEEDDDTIPRQGRQKRATRAPDMSKICVHCKKQGHLRKTNKLCELYVPPKKRGAGTNNNNIVEIKDDADEADAMDTLPLEDDSNASSGDDGYFDAQGGEYSSGDDTEDAYADVINVDNII